MPARAPTASPDARFSGAGARPQPRYEEPTGTGKSDDPAMGGTMTITHRHELGRRMSLDTLAALVEAAQ